MKRKHSRQLEAHLRDLIETCKMKFSKGLKSVLRSRRKSDRKSDRKILNPYPPARDGGRLSRHRQMSDRRIAVKVSPQDREAANLSKDRRVSQRRLAVNPKHRNPQLDKGSRSHLMEMGGVLKSRKSEI
jgi:hypothetical protein